MKLHDDVPKYYNTRNRPVYKPFASACYFSDAQGNVVGLAYTNETMAAQYEYDPFGNMLSMTGPLASANRYRFSSKEWNDSAGLYYYGFRFYDPNLQRWPNRDPLSDWGSLAYLGPSLNREVNSGNSGTMSHDEFVGLMAQINLNPFGAMNNNPINYLDPNGEFCGAAGAAATTFFTGTGETLGLGAMAGAGAAGVAGVAGVAGIGYADQAFINGLPAQTTFYNPQGNYVNAPPSSLVLASSFNPGYWPGPSGAAEWGTRNGVGAKEGKARFHDIKQGDNMSEPPHNYGVNPDTGDVQDPKGDSVGNLNDCHSD